MCLLALKHMFLLEFVHLDWLCVIFSYLVYSFNLAWLCLIIRVELDSVEDIERSVAQFSI